MITRRGFLAQGSSALLLSHVASASGCKRSVTREDVLAALARGVALPAMRVLADVDARLSSSLQALPDLPTARDLAAARAALAAAILAWERAYVFRSGPLVESNAFLRARFWPVRQSALHALLLGADAIDDARVAALGVDVKGLFALERLLWERVPSEQGDGFLFERAPVRSRALALALARDVAAHGAQAARLLGDGRAFVQKFAEGGQGQLTLLVTQLVQSVEALFTDRLERVLGLYKSGRLKSGELLGDFSGLSTRALCTSLHEVCALYLGAHEDGLSALVKQAAPSIDAHLRSALSQARSAADAIGSPLEHVVAHDARKIERARERVKAVELGFKVELTSALGVTLSIAAGDGD
jgi:predicted lipoprotein